MYKAKNIDPKKVNAILNMTGFNYGIEIMQNEDMTEDVVFDCKKDYNKFISLLNEIKKALS